MNHAEAITILLVERKASARLFKCSKYYILIFYIEYEDEHNDNACGRC